METEQSDLATNQGILATTGNWEKQGTHCPLEHPEGEWPCPHLDFGPLTLTSDFWSPELGAN